ncbi:hypothetical protein LCI18_011044 [Fusarium solani-melongenae]|uniref:Uncharacterized protein n=1 Tax=Fusarium solani subsp. cucurbitae TaxID=2747967 RepID=A0ACD3ZFP6_FUSSC|nr:hypothetical protein LCI18_011044 [Fusarium solani-melongenae]
MPPPSIPLQLMPQQVNVSTEDDWTGTSDPRARKKLQDRIHQRIRRKRMREILRPPRMPNLQSFFDERQLNTVTSCPGNLIGVDPLSIYSFTACEPESERTERFIIHFSTRVHADFTNGSPRADMLLSLVQFNTTRALVMNARIMNITSELMLPDARSRLPDHAINGAATIPSVPSSLEPTHLQLTVSHHPWVDILPFPEVRDNILRHDEKSYDKKALCRELRGFQDVANGLGGMIVWGDPSDSGAWEVTEAFASKWPWVIQDCPRLLESTRHWRSIRGES